MSWIDLFILMYELLFHSPKIIRHQEPKAKTVVIKKRPHISRDHFYDIINELLLISSHTYDLAANPETKDNILNVVELCQQILQAQDIKDQSHILFTDFYYEKIHHIYNESINIHRELCSIKTKQQLRNSFMSGLF